MVSKIANVDALILASRRFHLGIVPVIVPRPELAVDVDEPEDYALVLRVLEARGDGSEPGL